MALMFSRPEQINRWSIKIGYAIAGFLLLLNIHYSAVALDALAIQNGADRVGAFEILTSIYVPAIGASFVCFFGVGYLINPLGIPSALEQIQTVRAKAKSKISMVFGYFVIIGVLAGLMWVIIKCYQFDLYTTRAYLGTSNIPLTDYRMVGTWTFIVGPDVILLLINASETLTGKAPARNNAVKGGGQPQVRQQPAKQKMPGGNTWDIL